VKLHHSFLSMSVDARAIRFHKTNGMTFLTSTCGTCVVGTGRSHRPPGIPCWMIGTSRSRDNPCAAPPSLPHVLWKSDLFGAVLECSRVKCRLFPRRSGRGALDSSGPTTLKRISHVIVGRKKRTFLPYRSPYGTFFVVGGYPLVSDLSHFHRRDSSRTVRTGPSRSSAGIHRPPVR
jgi:hypothetical protein